VIISHPASVTVTAGQTASFNVAATGTPPLSYQWQKNGVNIAGATSASYTTPSTTLSDNGTTFRCIVSNSIGSATSNTATLTVLQQPSGPVITIHPISQTVTVGQTATFSVSATGTAPLSYQWQKNGVSISGATSASYTTPPTTLSDNGATFRCIVSNSLGSATSNTAILTVTGTPPQNNQLLLLDRTFVHSTSYSAALLGEIPYSSDPNCIFVLGIAYSPGQTGNPVCNHEAFKFFQMPSSNPSNWTSPINYAGGTLYQRIQIISKPTTTPVRYAMCMFQDQVLAPRHACGDLSLIAFTGPGTYYSSQSMSTFYQYDTAIDWTRKPHVIMLHMTDNNNHQTDSYPDFMNLWYGTPNWSLYYPMTLRYTAIVVPPGGGAPIWPN